MPIMKLSSKGQLVLPKEVRDQLGIQPGAALRVVVSGAKIEIEQLPKRLSERLYGRFAGTSLVQSLEADHAREIASKTRP